MNLYEVTLWPNNQSPILLGYYKAETVNGAKRKAAEEMTNQGCSLKATDPNLDVRIKSKNTPYEKWHSPKLSPEYEAILKRLTRKVNDRKSTF